MLPAFTLLIFYLFLKNKNLIHHIIYIPIILIYHYLKITSSIIFPYIIILFFLTLTKKTNIKKNIIYLIIFLIIIIPLDKKNSSQDLNKWTSNRNNMSINILDTKLDILYKTTIINQETIIILET